MGLSNRIKSTLDEYASEYYDAEQEGDRERINEVCREIGIDTAGFDAIGSGSGRNTFDMDIFGYPEYALKLAVPDAEYDGVEQNRREAELWDDADSDQREFLAPVVAHGDDYYWLVMKQGEQDVRIDYEWRTDAEFYLDGLVWEEDIREKNIVRIDGGLKICDYGTPPQ